MHRHEIAREVWRLTQEDKLSTREAAKRLRAQGVTVSASTAARMVRAEKKRQGLEEGEVQARTPTGSGGVSPAAPPVLAVAPPPAPERTIGRPTLCTAQLIAEAEEAAGLGMKYALIADYIGITERALYKWLQKGRSPDGGVYRRFVQAVKRGRARHAAQALRKIGGDDSWQSSAWMLERLHGYRRDEPAAVAPLPAPDPILRQKSTVELMAELELLEGGAS